MSAWGDQSGNSRNLAQATGTNQPTLQADGSILFDGLDNFMATGAFTLAQPFTVVTLVKQVTWTSLDRIWDGTNSFAFQLTSSPNIGINAGSSVGSATLTLGTWGVVTTIFNGASSVVQLNQGTPATGNAGAGNMSSFALAAVVAGTSRWCEAAYKENIVFPSALDAATRYRVIRYLMQVGGI